MKMVMNLPNVLSSMRIFLMPVIFFLIINSTPQNYGILVLIYLFSILFDFLDGYFARKFSQITDFGKLLDPVADKLLMFFILIALIIKTDFPLWVAIPIFLRDFLILLASFFIYRKNKKIKPSITIGKVAFGSLSFLIFLYILGLNSSTDLDLLKKFVSVFTISFLLWSWFEYLLIYLREKNG
ncbi:MAG: CDP-alcohol phosphatidyltransferase family protein [Acidobacteriota bacterium]